MIATADILIGSPAVSMKERAAVHSGSMREQQLVRRSQHGDSSGFDELVLAYQDAVYRQAFWILGSAEAAEDAAQEAFYRAYRSIASYSGPSFRAWILRITTNYCLDQLRRRKTHPSCSLEGWDAEAGDENENARWWMDAGPSPEQAAERSEQIQLIRSCLAKLSPEDRAPILLVDVQEMDYQEAAGILELPLGTFKSRLSRARGRLVGLLQRER